MIKTLTTLFEDEWLVAFDKPSGLLTAPDRWNQAHSDLISLARQNDTGNIAAAFQLDPETSGVLLCAKTKATLTALGRQFACGRAKTHYLALVNGTLPEPELVIHREIENDRSRPGRMRLAAAYRRGTCRTRAHAVEVFRAHSLLEAWPSAGKAHQVRIHMAYIGCPVVADALYGNAHGLYLSAIKRDYKFKPAEPERPLIGRLALHVASLTCTHPVTKKEITIRAPWPKDFAIAIKYLKKFASTGGNAMK